MTYKEYGNAGDYFYSRTKVLWTLHAAKGGKYRYRREPGASLRRASEEPWRLADREPGVKLPVTCQYATAANLGTAAARARAGLRGKR